MDRVYCARCGEEHDLSDLEPRFRRPDAYLAVPQDERERRAAAGDDWCRLRSADGSRHEYFLRVLLPIPIRGETQPRRWGIWVEVSEGAYDRANELWDDPAQAAEPPFPGRLANTLPGYPPTLGLPGYVQLTGPASAPTFSLDPEVVHPLATEQREGVYPERVLEWLSVYLHPRD